MTVFFFQISRYQVWPKLKVKARILIKEIHKREVFGKTDRLLSIDTTRNTSKMTSPKILQFLYILLHAAE
jgi:hypothetical protein